jgi:hypothetical protein
MNLLQDKRAWLGGGALAAVLIAVVSWFMVISPELSSASSLRTAADNAEAQNTTTQANVNRLRRQAENVGELNAKLAKALSALPTTSGLPAFTRQLNAQARATGVDVSSIVIGALSLANPAGTAATPATPATTTGAPAVTSQPVSAAGGVYAIPITMISTGSLVHELVFLKEIQTLGPRRVLVRSTQFAPGASARVASVDGSAVVTAQLTVFSAP